MFYLAIKALISGVVIAAVSEIAKRSPGVGALVASLPLISVLGMMWLWRDTRDPVRMAAHAGATFWFVLPSLPMFRLDSVLRPHATVAAKYPRAPVPRPLLRSGPWRRLTVCGGPIWFRKPDVRTRYPPAVQLASAYKRIPPRLGGNLP